MSASTAATLTASYSGVSKTFGVTVNPQAAALSSVSVTPSMIVVRQWARGTVNLTAPAGTGGVVVSLANSNTGAVSIPSSVTVAQGSTSATFLVTARRVITSTAVTLTASYLGVSAVFNVTINPLPPALSSISVYPQTIISGQSGTGTIRLTTAAGTGGVVVLLSSSNATAASVPLKVTIPEGSTSARFTVTTGAVSAPNKPILTASYSGVSKTIRVIVDP